MVYESPCGKLLLGARCGSIVLCDWIRGSRIEETLRRISTFLPGEGNRSRKFPDERRQNEDEAVFATKAGYEDGWLTAVSNGENTGLTSVASWDDNGAFEDEDEVVLKVAVGMLDEYLEGKRREFDLPINLCGTEFQRRVWAALEKIPYGKMVGYQAVAESIGKPQATRAVASAIGANPVSILIPCHRVIRSDGSTGRYAGGPEAKCYLLQLESASLLSGERRG